MQMHAEGTYDDFVAIPCPHCHSITNECVHGVEPAQLPFPGEPLSMTRSCPGHAWAREYASMTLDDAHHSLPIADLDWAPYVYMVLQQVHPGLDIMPSAQLVMEDLMADTEACQATHPYLVGPNDSMRWASGSELTSPALLAGLAEWDASPHEAKAQALKEVRWGLAKTTGDCINVERMEMAVRLVLTGELAKHVLDEGYKAVDKFGVNFNPLDIPGEMLLAQCASLQFPVAQAGAFATLMSGLVVEGSAAVFLAAVLEYMAAEITELSGN
ncbi:hypothetical protein T484DRAFT_1817204, partial [Baffinella frigidus]